LRSGAADPDDRGIGVRGRSTESGEVLRAVAIPPARQPRMESRTAALATVGLFENAREAMAAPPTLGTSATGAKVTLIPASRNARAATVASNRTLPAAACSGSERTGPAHGTRRTRPPSWSTAISGRPPWRRRERVSEPSCSGEAMLPPKRMTPAARLSRSVSST
jgi:hypothetical protein